MRAVLEKIGCPEYALGRKVGEEKSAPEARELAVEPAAVAEDEAPAVAPAAQIGYDAMVGATPAPIPAAQLQYDLDVYVLGGATTTRSLAGCTTGLCPVWPFCAPTSVEATTCM